MPSILTRDQSRTT